MFRRFKEKHPYFFDQFRRIAGKVALGALLLYGCSLLIVWSFQMGPLRILMSVYVLWLLIEFIPAFLLPGRSRKSRVSLFEKTGKDALSLRQLIWTVAFMAAILYACAVILIAGYTAKTPQALFLSHIITVPILVACILHLIKTIRRYMAARVQKPTLSEPEQNELARAEELYKAGIYSRKEFVEKKAQILKEAATKPMQTPRQK